jgi:hypothetical protein
MPSIDSQHEVEKSTLGTVKLPAPTAWPIVLAFGVTLLSAGLVTSSSVSFLGAILAVVGCVGWFRDVLPHEKHVSVPTEDESGVLPSSHRKVERLPEAPELVRAMLPLETYPISAGVKGGIAGAAAMAVCACLYGILKQGSIWYPINLLAATIYGQSMLLTPGTLNGFHLGSFLMACFLHLLTSVLVGLMYGAMLPMFPRRPILLGGVIAPIMWSGLIHSVLGFINPMLDQRIDWVWFVISQFAFGITAGLVVARQTKIRTRQILPFSMRAGFETSQTMGETRSKDRPR